MATTGCRDRDSASFSTSAMSGGHSAVAESDEEEEDDDDNEATMAQKLAKSKNPVRTVSHSPCFEIGECLGILYVVIYFILIYCPCWCAGKVKLCKAQVNNRLSFQNCHAPHFRSSRPFDAPDATIRAKPNNRHSFQNCHTPHFRSSSRPFDAPPPRRRYDSCMTGRTRKSKLLLRGKLSWLLLRATTWQSR